MANAPGLQCGRKSAEKAAKANVARNEWSLVLSCEEMRRTHLPRIRGVESKQAPWHVRLIYWFRKRKYGHVTEGTKILAYDPRLLRQFVRMTMYSESKGVLPPRLKRLAMLKTAMLVGCPF